MSKTDADHPWTPWPRGRAYVGKRAPYSIECEKGHTGAKEVKQVKGPMKVKGLTEVNFKHGGDQQIIPGSPTFKTMAPPLNVVQS